MKESLMDRKLCSEIISDVMYRYLLYVLYYKTYCSSCHRPIYISKVAVSYLCTVYILLMIYGQKVTSGTYIYYL